MKVDEFLLNPDLSIKASADFLGHNVNTMIRHYASVAGHEDLAAALTSAGFGQNKQS